VIFEITITASHVIRQSLPLLSGISQLLRNLLNDLDAYAVMKALLKEYRASQGD